MSKRRGKISVEKEEVERRLWFENLERQVFPADTEVFAERFRPSTSQAQWSSIASSSERNSSNNKHQQQHQQGLDGTSHPSSSSFSSSSSSSSSLLICSMNKPSTIQSYAFFFPGIGNSHAYFKRWAQPLQQRNVQMYGICLKGRMHRFLEDASENNVEAIAREVYLFIRRLDIVDMSMDPEDLDADRKVTIVLFGHNLGAFIAFEVTRLLQSNGLSSRSDCSLVASSAWGPVFRTDLNKRRAERAARWAEKKYIDPYDERINGIDVPCNGLCELEITTPKWTFRDLKAYILASNLVPACLSEHQPLLKSMQTLARADIALLETYQLRPPDLDMYDVDAEKSTDPNVVRIPKSEKVSVPIVTIYAEDDENFLHHDKVQSWELSTSGRCEHHPPLKSGKHNFLMEDENQQFFAELFDALFPS